MRFLGRRWIVALAIVACLAATGIFGFFLALRHVPAFYTELLTSDPKASRTASDQMLRRVGALTSDLQRPGQWQSTFTQDEINGWLAVDLVENHSYALEGGVTSPRVRIRENEIILAFRYSSPVFSGVVTVTLEPYIERPNVVAVRFRGARAGMVPLPLQSILDSLSTGLTKSEYRVEWSQSHGDPVALITIPPPRRKNDKPVTLDAIRVLDGKVVLSGTTEKGR